MRWELRFWQQWYFFFCAGSCFVKVSCYVLETCSFLESSFIVFIIIVIWRIIRHIAFRFTVLSYEILQKNSYFLLGTIFFLEVAAEPLGRFVSFFISCKYLEYHPLSTAHLTLQSACKINVFNKYLLLITFLINLFTLFYY